jgi:hypothetical protein
VPERFQRSEVQGELSGLLPETLLAHQRQYFMKHAGELAPEQMMILERSYYAV